MIKNKNSIKLVFILSAFLILAEPIQGFDPRPITINIGLVFAVLNCAALFRSTPSLYPKPQGNYVQILEDRLDTLKFILESPTEDQLIAFKYELIGYYVNILNKRDILSKIFENGIPDQPFALLDEEMKQHCSELEFWEKLLSYAGKSEEMENRLERIRNLKSTLTSIQRRFQSYTCYQVECSLARQNDYLYKVFHITMAIFLFYLVDQELNSISKKHL